MTVDLALLAHLALVVFLAGCLARLVRAAAGLLDSVAYHRHAQGDSVLRHAGLIDPMPTAVDDRDD